MMVGMEEEAVCAEATVEMGVMAVLVEMGVMEGMVGFAAEMVATAEMVAMKDRNEGKFL